MTIVHEAAGQQTFRFEGHLDTIRCDEIKDAIQESLTASDAAVVFDLADVTFICSAFLRLCVLAMQRRGDGRFHVINTTPSIKRVFTIAGLSSVVA